jgi:hypothetical protein
MGDDGKQRRSLRGQPSQIRAVEREAHLAGWAIASIYNATEPNAMVPTRLSSRAYSDRAAQRLRCRPRPDKVVISVPHVPQGMLSRYGEPRTWPIAPAVAKLLRNTGVRYGYKSGPGRKTTRVRSHSEHGDQMRLAASAGRAFKYRQTRLPRGRGAITGA